MKISLVLLVLVPLATAGGHHYSSDSSGPAKAFLSKIKRQSHKSRGMCSADVIPYPLNGIRVQQENDITSETARSYYDNFSIRQQIVRNNAVVSQFQVGIEYKNPVQGLSLAHQKRAEIHFYNLLFTASLRVRTKDSKCKKPQLSLLGFVELVKTDVSWHRSKNGITQHTGKNLAKNDQLQYVMTKSSQRQKTMFANDSTWARTIAIPLSIDYVVPLKYESAESIVVDFARYRDTERYEKLTEKKIFLVQTNLYNEVTEVLAGVDVMMYLNYETISVTNVPQLNLTKSHGLIQQISNPEKYASVITNLHRKGTESIRDRSLTKEEYFPSSVGDTSLDPLLKSTHIFTE